MKADSEEKNLELSNIDPVTKDWENISSPNASVLNMAFGGGWRVYSSEYADLLTARLKNEVDKISEGEVALRHTHTLVVPESPARTRLKTVYAFAIGVAVTFCVLFGAGWLTDNPLVNGVSPDHSTAIQSHVYSTARGDRATVVLPDGSTAILNADTRLIVSRTFGNTDRRITVEGEAYLSVIPQLDKPFLVHAGSSTTKVLGTEFNVKAYTTDSSVQISVISGKVLVDHTILAVGDVASIKDSSNVLVYSNKNVSRHTEWMRGNLDFDDIPFDKIVRQIERMYDVEIRLSDTSIGKHRLSGTLMAPSLNDAVHYFSSMLDATVERNGRIITFHKK